jgi:hypothetical protein
VSEAGCKHQVVKTGSGPAAARVAAFKWVNSKRCSGALL